MSSKISTSKLHEVAVVIDSLHKTPRYSNSGHPMVRCVDLIYGRLKLEKTNKVAAEVFAEYSKKYCPKKWDIIITRVGANFGVTSYVDDTEFCLGQNTAAITPKINPRYLYYVLNSSTSRQQMNILVAGAAQPTLSLKSINNLDIPRFGLEVEAEIGSTLGAIDDRIDLLHETNATLEAIAQALFKSWFVDFDPVHAKRQGLAPEGMDEATAALFPDCFEESNLGVVPRGWDVLELGDICELQKGCSYKGDGLSEDQGAYMFNLGCFNAPRVFANEKVKRYRGEYRDRHAVTSGDLIVANTDMTQERAILGRPLLVPEGFSPGFISHHVFKVSPRGEHPREIKSFLFFTFLQQFFRERAVGYATGTTVLALPKDAFQKHLLVKPDEKLIRKFGNLAGSIFSAIATNLEKTQTLATLRDTLLPRLISGQLRLPEAEALIEDAA